MFQGFSQNAIDFLWGISLNNERGWFMAHKQDFTDYVDIPMRELGKAVFSALAEEFQLKVIVSEKIDDLFALPALYPVPPMYLSPTSMSPSF